VKDEITVEIRNVGEVGRYEALAWNLQKRGEQLAIGHVGRPDLAVHHRPARCHEIDHRGTLRPLGRGRVACAARAVKRQDSGPWVLLPDAPKGIYRRRDPRVAAAAAALI